MKLFFIQSIESEGIANYLYNVMLIALSSIRGAGSANIDRADANTGACKCNINQRTLSKVSDIKVK